MEHIAHGLWITDIGTVRTQSTERFDTVVSVCQDAAPDNVSCEYQHFELADDRISEQNWGGSADYETFATAADSVVTALDNGEVLVHCHAGQNRSVAICAAAIAVHEDSGYHDAFGKVGAAREVVNPNVLMKSYARCYIESQ